MLGKSCTQCEQHKALSEFSFRPDRPGKLKSACKSCENIRKREWFRANPDKGLNARLKNEYGITLEQYNKLFQEQKGCCAICGAHQTAFKQRFSVDHCHTTGTVRGLLCQPCNLGLGNFKDNRESLLNAIAYLDKEN